MYCTYQRMYRERVIQKILVFFLIKKKMSIFRTIILYELYMNEMNGIGCLLFSRKFFNPVKIVQI
ncbi:hypothetical protein C2G38_2073127, partial [Gigaspora rosea]